MLLMKELSSWKTSSLRLVERLSQIIDAKLPSSVTGEAIVASGVTISVGFLIPDTVLVLC